jgi:hypothetical protein
VTKPSWDDRETDLAVTGMLLALLAIVAVWNAIAYPPIGGFDAQEHITYARSLVERGELPQEGAYYTPPGFYLVAGAAIQVGELIRLGDPERAAQFVNVALTIGTGLLLVALTRLLFPGRPIVRWAALAFFLSCPVVLKTTAMFHPQPLALCLSTAALTLTCHMIVRRRYGLWNWILLAVLLGAAQLVRSVGLWTVGVVGLTLVVAAAAQAEQRREIARGLSVAAAAALLLAVPWYVHLQRTTGSAVFGRTLASISDSWDTAFVASPGLPAVITDPHRVSLRPRFLPILYTDTWGDYFGIWAWNPPRPELTPSVNRRLVVQSLVGLPLTALSVAGWFALLALAVIRWRDAPERLLVVLMPIVALVGTLYYSLGGPSADGDTVKAMFLLPAVPGWAISFGFAADVLAARSRHVAAIAFGLLALCGLVSLVFATYASVS